MAVMPLVLPPSRPCPFCKYLARERPYTILDRQQRTAMLVTHEQRGRGHLLVVPIAHRETILDLTAEEQSAVMADVVRASHAIIGAYDPDASRSGRTTASPPASQCLTYTSTSREPCREAARTGVKSPAQPSPRRTPSPSSSGHTYLSSTGPYRRDRDAVRHLHG